MVAFNRLKNGNTALTGIVTKRIAKHTNKKTGKPFLSLRMLSDGHSVDVGINGTDAELTALKAKLEATLDDPTRFVSLYAIKAPKETAAVRKDGTPIIYEKGRRKGEQAKNYSVRCFNSQVFINTRNSAKADTDMGSAA